MPKNLTLLKHKKLIWKKRTVNGINFPYIIRNPNPNARLMYHFYDPPESFFLKKTPLTVLLTKNVERLGRKGDLIKVPRGVYRYFLLENDAAKPISHWSQLPQEVIDVLSVKREPINTPELEKEAYEKAVSILKRGVNINFESLATWIITPFHLAKILSFRTGFNIDVRHVKMETSAITTPGDFEISFKHENGMNLKIPISIKIKKN